MTSVGGRRPPRVPRTPRIPGSERRPATSAARPGAAKPAHDDASVVEHGRGERLQRFVPPAKTAETAETAETAGAPRAASLVALRANANHDTLDVVFKKHLVDFRTAFAEMRKQPPSVVFFGGARLKPGDPYYKLAEDFGRACGRRGIPPKTGRGPGAMHAAPAAFIEERDGLRERVVQSLVDGVSRLSDLEDQRTLGFNIELPNEQAASPAVENGAEIQNFAFRKFSLYENVRGVVVMPGGFGTIDELMEVLVLKHNGRTRDPVVLAGKDYWQPILDAWKQAARRHGADLLAGLLDEVLVTDDPEQALDFIEKAPGVRAFDEDPDVLYKRMVREIKLARYVAVHQEPAITVLGGAGLHDDDPAREVAAALGRRAAETGAAIRVGEDGAVARALADAPLQRVLWSPGAEPLERKAKPDVDDVTFGERVPHKEALLRNSTAYVVLPDATRGKDELCTVLCQIQTGKLPQRPIVLVDSAFWKPIFEAWRAQMIGEKHAYIAPSDMQLVTFADSFDDVARALGSTLA